MANPLPRRAARGLVAFAAVLGCVFPPFAAANGTILDVEWPWSANGTSSGYEMDTFTVLGRSVHVYVPLKALQSPDPVPVVVDFHALGSTAFDEAYLTQIPGLADKEGFVAVYPSGKSLSPPAGPGYSWNAGACCPYANALETDDIGLARALPEALVSELLRSRNVTVDARRIYATGMSNGGFMTNRVACEASDLYAAFAPVSGLYAPGPAKAWPSKPFPCEPSRKVPLLHFHGKADPIVPFAGNAELGFPAVEEYIAGWRQRNKLGDEATETYRRGAVVCSSWGKGDANVTLCSIDKAGHSWPGSTAPLACPSTGSFACTRDVDATREIWRFLQRYRLPQ